MKIKEIMEATPGNGPASATQVKPPAPARPPAPAPKPAPKPATPAAKPATPPAAKSVSDAELNAALGMQQLKGIADRARQAGKAVDIEPGAQAAIDKSVNSAAGKKAADILDLNKNKVPPLKVDPKQVNQMMQSGPAT
jgi:hypothetical protein